MESPLQLAITMTRQAGTLLKDLYRPEGIQARQKPDHTLVTEADLVADRLIKDEILQYFPEHVIVSEELQPDLHQQVSRVWVVDPLDGTTNFSLGFPIWGISVAYLEDGWPVAAAIHFPMLDELYSAERGSGAMLNGEPIHARPPIPDQPAAFFSCCSRTYRHYQVDIRYKARILGSACYTLCAVARGLAVLGFETTPKIWDLAGGWLILQEAGGVVEIYDGDQPFPLRSQVDYRQINYPILAAATPELVAKARQQIKPR
jgi:myo-inositol-1(or 4)-monophosphatase